MRGGWGRVFKNAAPDGLKPRFLKKKGPMAFYMQGLSLGLKLHFL